MKKKSKSNQKQADLFFELSPYSSPIPNPIALQGHQEIELEQALVELLLGVARNNQGQTGADDDI